MGLEDLWRKQLDEGCRQLGLSLEEDRVDPLIAYLHLLRKWNRVFNLTAVRDERELVSRHLVDSLSIAASIRGPRIADIGSGAGLPGIPLGVMRGDWQFVLVDSNSKKTRFLNQVILELGLSNLEVVHSRVEAFRPQQGFDTVVSRAFSSLADFWRMAGHLIVPGGRLVAMKGRRPDEELAQLPDGVAAETRVLVSAVPDERHVVVLQAEKLG